MKLYERQCTTCGLIYDLSYQADAKYFKCYYCDTLSVWQESRSQKMLERNKKEIYVGEENGNDL